MFSLSARMRLSLSCAHVGQLMQLAQGTMLLPLRDGLSSIEQSHIHYTVLPRLSSHMITQDKHAFPELNRSGSPQPRTLEWL